MDLDRELRDVRTVADRVGSWAEGQKSIAKSRVNIVTCMTLLPSFLPVIFDSMSVLFISLKMNFIPFRHACLK